MSSASNVAGLAVACVMSVAAVAAPLRVCSDPNNMPYSNDRQQGFENQLATLIADDLHMELTYFWFPQREAFFRKTLNQGVCDVVMGVPAGIDEADVTRPYYRSTYVFIARRDRNLHISSLDDPRLRTLKVGVHILGEQDDSLPPVHALVSRGIVRNLVGFSIFGNLNEKDPPADLLRAVADGKVDVAVAWGPLAGYFAKHSPVPLEITPISEDPTHPDLPFNFEIGIGVRANDAALKQTLNSELNKLQPQIHELLNSYGVPQLSLPAETSPAESATKEDR